MSGCLSVFPCRIAFSRSALLRMACAIALIEAATPQRGRRVKRAGVWCWRALESPVRGVLADSRNQLLRKKLVLTVLQRIE